jgi:IS605 OrfB family transposase
VFKTQQIRLTGSISDELHDYLVYLCEHASSLINCVTYHIRQKHFDSCERIEFFDKDGFYRSEFKTKRVAIDSYAQLCKDFADNRHYKILGGQQAQQVIKSVIENFRGYNELLSKFFKGELKGKPKMPGYRSKGGLSLFTIPAQALKFDIETGECRLPVSRENAFDVPKDVWMPGGFGFKPEQISEVRILPRNRQLYAEYVYNDNQSVLGASCLLGLNPKEALGIDPGTVNWITGVSTLNKSFIIDGRKLKSINQRYNRAVAKIKKGKPQAYWDDELAQLAEKRNRVMRDAINKTARFVVNYCLSHKIGNVVFGWGQGIKDKIQMGKKHNQNFVQIPTAKLKVRIQQLCEETGIQFHETEESYTSKTSFLDDDFLPTLGEKPQGWKPSGKRGQKGDGIGRGQYRTASGLLINSDCQGAVNIIRKVMTQLGITLAKVTREALTLPKRYNVFGSLKKVYRKRCVGVLLAPVATSV